VGCLLWRVLHIQRVILPVSLHGMTSRSWLPCACCKYHSRVTVGRTLLNNYIFQKGLECQEIRNLICLYRFFRWLVTLPVKSVCLTAELFCLALVAPCFLSMKLLRWQNHKTAEIPFRQAKDVKSLSTNNKTHFSNFEIIYVIYLHFNFSAL